MSGERPTAELAVKPIELGLKAAYYAILFGSRSLNGVRKTVVSEVQDAWRYRDNGTRIGYPISPQPLAPDEPPDDPMDPRTA